MSSLSASSSPRESKSAAATPSRGSSGSTSIRKIMPSRTVNSKKVQVPLVVQVAPASHHRCRFGSPARVSRRGRPQVRQCPEREGPAVRQSRRVRRPGSSRNRSTAARDPPDSASISLLLGQQGCHERGSEELCESILDDPLEHSLLFLGDFGAESVLEQFGDDHVRYESRQVPGDRACSRTGAGRIPKAAQYIQVSGVERAELGRWLQTAVGGKGRVECPGEFGPGHGIAALWLHKVDVQRRDQVERLTPAVPEVFVGPDRRG